MWHCIEEREEKNKKRCLRQTLSLREIRGGRKTPCARPPRRVRPMIACVPRSLASSHRQDLAPLQSQADVVLAAPSLELTVDLSVPRTASAKGDAAAQLPRAGHVDDCAGLEGIPEHSQLHDEDAAPAAVDGVQV